MKHTALLLAACAAMCTAAPATAQSTGSGHVAVSGGTLGFGPEVGYRADSFGVRANATFFGFSRDVESDGVDYDGKLKLRSFGAMVDFYPFGGGFRVSPGLRISRNRVKLDATPTEDVEIGDEIYTPAEIGTIEGEVRARRIAPTLTLGWATSGGSGLYFGADAGVMFQGAPRVRNLRTSGLLDDDEFQDDLERERDEIEDDIDNFKVYPILQFALGFRFGGESAPVAYVAPAAAPPAPAAPATQTCADGSVILATDFCPAPPPPPAPPAAPGERG